MTEVSLDTTAMVVALRKEVLNALGIPAMQNAAKPVTVDDPVADTVHALRVGSGVFERGPAIHDMTCRFPVTFYYARKDAAGTEPAFAVQSILETIALAATKDPGEWATETKVIRSTLTEFQVGGDDPYSQLFGESDAPYTAGFVTVELEFIA